MTVQTGTRAALRGTAAAVLFAAGLASAGEPTPMDQDPRLWLEDVDGKRAMQWVAARNRATQRTLASGASFKRLRTRLLEAFDAEDRIPAVGKLGARYYNFWRDKSHPRGLWRRTTLAEYRRPSPNWEPVLDLDALARRERENWVLSSFYCREPDYQRCLVLLSRGGADAVVVREFDLERKAFVDPKDGGFVLPEAKSSVDWAGPDAIFVATDFGPGTTTESGYPRIVKIWRRSRPLAAAETVFEGNATDVSIGAYSDLGGDEPVQVVWQGTDFHNSVMYLRQEAPAGDEAGGTSGATLVRLPKPDDAEATVHRGRVFIALKSDWTVGTRRYRAGSLLAGDLAGFLAGRGAFAALFEPSAGTSLAGYAPTRDHVLVNVLDNVRNRVYVATPPAPSANNGGWTLAPLFAVDGFRTVSVSPVAPHEDNRYFAHSNDYLTPPTLALGNVGQAPEVLKRAPAFFDSEGHAIAQHWATSKDGTRIPYFEVGARDRDGPQPTLLYGYGGFEIPLLPGYSAGVGIAWLARGGIYVVANIRGGGEFGPSWHQAALKERRGRAYEDFVAVAEHLVERGVATTPQLGILGGSNGGLLMGNMLTMRPALFGAIAAQVPLFDMHRYHKLLAGASWVAEYGDPDDPGDWLHLRRYSPYHNVRADAAYPPLLVTTSTRDDRVHPGHARKMVAKMREMGHDVTYYENTEGGHGGAADNAQSAFMWALVYEFLWRRLSAGG